MSDPFDDIVAGLDLAEPETQTPCVTDYADGELMLEFSRVKQELLAAGDMLSNHPSPATADLLSWRGALIIEMRRRNLG